MTARTPLEQMLLTQSLERSLEEVSLHLPVGTSLTVAAAGPTNDKDYARELFTTWFRRRGFVVLEEKSKDAVYEARITLHAFATEKSDTFFGIPPIQSMLIPFATPELTFYRALRLRGVSRFSLDLFQREKPEPVANRPVYEAAVNYNRYTILFVFSFKSTDLIPPPI